MSLPLGIIILNMGTPLAAGPLTSQLGSMELLPLVCSLAWLVGSPNSGAAEKACQVLVGRLFVTQVGSGYEG